MSGEASAKADDDLQARSLAYARDLVKQIEKGNWEDADRIISALGSIRDNDLYQEVGRLTRGLHEKINGIIDDTRMCTITQEEIPEAKGRLDYVIKLTEKSAHNTLALVEHSIPVIDGLGADALELNEQWQQLKRPPKEINVQDFLQLVIDETKTVHSDLTEIVMAQSYQDITGQLIQRVMDILHDVENSLLNIMQASSNNKNDSPKPDAKQTNNGYGPAIPGVQNRDVLNNQDDVDDLLSTLGF